MPHVPGNCHQLLTHPTRTPLAEFAGSQRFGRQEHQADKREMNPKRRIQRLTKNYCTIATGPTWWWSIVCICLKHHTFGVMILLQHRENHLFLASSYGAKLPRFRPRQLRHSANKGLGNDEPSTEVGSPRYFVIGPGWEIQYISKAFFNIVHIT